MKTTQQENFYACRETCMFEDFERFSFETNTKTLKPVCQCIKRGKRWTMSLFDMTKRCSCQIQNTKKSSGLCVYLTDIRGNIPSPANEIAFFNGDTLDDTPKLHENIRLSLVISHCDENMSWMKNFLTHEIENVTIYSKCDFPIQHAPPGSKIISMPNYGRCDHSYANWMIQMKEEDATENHIVLFLKASRKTNHHPGMQYRSLRDMIRIAMINGFSCGYKSNSIYFHDTARLKNFNISEYKRKNIKSSYDNMGHYLDTMGIELPPTSPVCYGGNFAAKATRIYSRKTELEKTEKSLLRGDSIEEGHFVERLWAVLLSNPLNSNEIDVLQRIPTIVDPMEMGYVGRLISLADPAMT